MATGLSSGIALGRIWKGKGRVVSYGRSYIYTYIYTPVKTNSEEALFLLLPGSKWLFILAMFLAQGTLLLSPCLVKAKDPITTKGGSGNQSRCNVYSTYRF